jgi:hypothetical protein
MSAMHAAVARTAADQRSRDTHADLMKLANLEHAAGNSAAYAAVTACATIALSRTIQTGSDACS